MEGQAPRDAEGRFTRKPRVKLKSLVGRRFGRLKVLRFAGYEATYLQTKDGVRRKTTRRLWKCSCRCGNTTVLTTNVLTRGNTESCGCLRREKLTNRQHGMTDSPTYRSWGMMLARCRDKKDKNYGGANPPVTVCRAWQTFKGFLKSMGVRPAGTTLSRYADTGNYKKSNCAWHTRAQQGIERRKHFALRRGAAA
jgi:hypothetical protein